jgi:uncharacterized protein
MVSLVASLIVATMLQAPIPAQRSSSSVVSQTREILAAMVAGDFATVEKQFTDDMKAALPPGALAAMSAKLLNQVGAYKGCGTDPRVTRIDDKDMVITLCEFERTTIDIQFEFDSAGRISGLVLRPKVETAGAYTLPSYATPSSFVERELTLGSTEWVLPATPTGAAWPAIVLVHGSGATDRPARGDM